MENFSKIECANCGILFGLSPERVGRLRVSHEGFYCPSGHGQSFTAKSEVEKLRDLINEKNQEINNLKNPPVKRGRPSKKK